MVLKWTFLVVFYAVMVIHFFLFLSQLLQQATSSSNMSQFGGMQQLGGESHGLRQNVNPDL